MLGLGRPGNSLGEGDELRFDGEDAIDVDLEDYH